VTQRYATAFVSISVMLSTIMQVLDTTIANVALPHMQGALGATSDQITWVLTSYIVATAIMTLPVGYLARRFGRRRLLLWSVAGFTVASLLCGQAESLEEMVLWRLLQGVCGASLVPLSQSTLLDSFPVEKHAGAMSIWGTGVMLGPILGPTLGGWLTDFYSWRWVFLINLPIGMASFAGIYFFVKETPITRQRFDLFGFSLLALCVGTLQLMLDRGELVMWFESIEVKLYVITCVFALYFFVVHSKTSDDTLFSPGLFRDRNFVSGISFIFFIGIILLATMVLLPPFMQVWKGYPVVTTGLLLMPRGVGTMLTMMMAGRLLRYFDGRAVILCGMCLLSYSLYLMAGFNLQVSQFDIIASGVIQGLGLGLVFIPATTLAYATLSPSLRDEGTALFNLARNMGTSVGVSIVMAMLSRNLWINQQDIAARLTLDASRLPVLPGGTELGQMPAAIISEVSRQAAEIAFVNDFYLLMWINLLAMPLVLLLRNPARRSSGAAG
jgi:DHA2 family multidrug resistance protein